MSEKIRADKHVKLYIPGPTEVRPEVLDCDGYICRRRIDDPIIVLMKWWT